MITRELWVWAILCVLSLVLMVVYMAFTWGDFRAQRRVQDLSVRFRRRMTQAEANLLAGACISWQVLCCTGAAIIFLLRAKGQLSGQEWAQIGTWMLIALLLGVPGWVAVKLYTRRKLDELE